MTRKTLIGIASLFPVIAAIWVASAESTAAADPQVPVIQVVGSDATSRFVRLGIGKSVVIDLPRDIKDVLISEPKIANAIVRSTRRAYIIGQAVGQTNIYFFDTEGRQIGGLDIAVTRDLNGLRAAIKDAIPGADIQVAGLGEGVVLTGNVSNGFELQAAVDIAARLIGDDKKVVKNVTIHSSDQVMLKVTVAEVQRDIIKQLGINVNGGIGFGSTVINFNTTNQANAPLSDSGNPGISGKFKSVNATLRAMESAGVTRTLAEPTLTAISGDSASFLAGGEFPYVTVTQSSTGFPTTTTAFKPFGVRLNFTPVVLSEGRISLRVMTEVSELSAEGAIGGVPALKTRRVESTLEIPSGGSLAMAGMIQESTKQHINGFPGLMQVPILGALFKSRDYLNNQTELMVIVTPYIARAVARKNLARPDDGFADASDPASILLGKFNRLYGVPAKPPKGKYNGIIGFILD
jgi:pilus assembly protein CpaC